ncbi:MAG TPA: M56 family metallopeptidase, partial [Vicinamibacterales bacterium]|nr:M56 family metallopeptidase [Vicinamibacterales bacterium]
MLGAWTVTAARSVPDVSKVNVEGGLQTALKTTSPAPAPPLLGPGFLDFSSAIRELRPSDLNQPVAPTWPARIERWSTAAVPLWFAGVVLLSLRVLIGWIGLERLRRTQVVPAAADLAARVAMLAARVRVSRPVRVVQSAAVHVPSVVGWLRPIILLPASALSGLSPAQLDAVLAHELAHVRRHDFAVNALQTAADVLLFYHPACWWLSRRIRVEREHCCDDIAVAVCGDRLTYAAALADLEALRQQPALALAATDGPLLQRVRRVIAPPHDGATPAWVALALPLAVAAIVIGGVAVATAQQAAEHVRVPGMGRTIPGDRGVIKGQVVEAGTGRPIAGARVEIRGRGDQVFVTTDQAGRYETRPLMPGTYSVTATAPGHATAFYDGRAGSPSQESSLQVQADTVTVDRSRGAQRITVAGNVEIRKSITVDVGPGVLVPDIDVAMEATVELSGRILDDRGRGLPGAYIQLVATRPGPIDPAPRVAFARSDDDGVYRVAAPPGDYAVRAYIGTNVRPSKDAALAYVSTFYPGVRSQDAAQVIHVEGGVNQYDVDFALLSDRTARVSGALIDPSGHTFEDIRVSLRAFRSAAEGTVQLELSPRGEFVARDVVPGTYVVEVTDPRRPERWKAPRPPLEITDDVAGLEIHAVAPASITGRVVKDPRSTGRVNLTQTVISFTNRNEGANVGMSAFNLEEDGSFHGELPPGVLTLMVMGPSGWAMRSVRLDGADAFGYPLEITSGAHEIEVAITDRHASLNGLVVDRRGAPLGGFDVVLFPQDEGRWHFLSPFIRQTRSHQNGQFEIPQLPAGDYLAVATEGVPMILLGDPALTLRRLQSIGTRLKVGDGEQKTISIRASPAPGGLA